MPTPPRSRTVPLGTGLTYHFLEWGGDDSGRTHTVFLIHGFLDLAWGWVRLVEAGLGHGELHVVAPDLRGHGDSDRVGPGGYYHFLDYLADLDDLVGALGRDRISLVGHSMGATIASYYAGTYPERIHRLALLEGTGPPQSPTSMAERVASWLAGWQRVRTQTPPSYATVEEAALRLRKHDPMLGEGLARELAERGTRRGTDGRLRFKHDPLHLTLSPYPFRVDMAETFWRRITCPVLVIEGEDSRFRHEPAEAERRLRFFARATDAVVPKAGHMMQRHQPRALADLLIEFLRS